MCELFGFTGYQKENLSPMLREFFSHSVRHPNGWGLARLDNREPQIEKEPVCANESKRLASLLTEELQGQTLLGHIRRATIGNVSWKNCHPYIRTDASGRTWTLIHNGTIFDFPPLGDYYGMADGETDSACILTYLVAEINRATEKIGRALDDKQRFQVLNRMVTEMSPGNKLNLLIFDGTFLYVHTNMERTLYHRETVSGVVFSTIPLDEATWESVPMTRLLAYRNGALVMTGSDHKQQYWETAEQRTALALNYVVY